MDSLFLYFLVDVLSVRHTRMLRISFVCMLSVSYVSNTVSCIMYMYSIMSVSYVKSKLCLYYLVCICIISVAYCME